MSGSSRSSLGGTLAGLFYWVGLAKIISEAAHISFILALAILAAIAACGIFLVVGFMSTGRWWARCKPCQHGIWAGLSGRCQRCQTEVTRIQQQNETKALEWKRRHLILDEGKKLRKQEIERLSKAWLPNTESYLQMGPQQFEDAVAELFRKLGYSVTQTPYSNDGGKDAIAHKGGRTYLIECKRYDRSGSIGRRDIQIFVAAMQDEKASGGFYINTGTFTRNAKEYAEKNRVELYDHLRLPELVNEAYPVLVDITTASVMCLECGSVASMPVADVPVMGTCVNGHPVTSNITKANLQIFSSTGVPPCDRCGSPMRIVKGCRGQFWGCSGYPKCRNTKRFEP